MYTNKFYRKFVKSLTALKILSKKELKSFAVMENYQWIEVTYLFINDYDNF